MLKLKKEGQMSKDMHILDIYNYNKYIRKDIEKIHIFG